MKKNSLTTAVVAGIAGVAGFAGLANAVHLNPDGIGQVLLYPYYTVNNSQQTLLSVVNTTSVAKAVKVRFLEGYNSREVLDFNLFLSRYDVWTATVFALSDDGQAGNGAAILTRDKSCTAPAFSEENTNTSGGTPYVAFRDFAYLAPDDGGPSTIDRTREGHFEIISMADLSGALATAVTHSGASQTPPGCTAVRNLQGGETGIDTPTSGLFGGAGVINGGAGTYFAYNADALDRFTFRSIFTPTGSIFPNLAFVNDGTGGLAFQATANVFTGTGVTTSTYPGASPDSDPVDAVTAIFAANNIYNEYQTSTALAAGSDWVVTFPTKAFYVDELYIGAGNPAVKPFTRVYDGTPGAVPQFSCVAVGLSIYDQEEKTTSGVLPGFSPPPPGAPPSSLCKETNVISFLNVNSAPTQSGVLGSRLVTNVKPAVGAAGWLRLDLDPAAEPHSLLAATNGNVFRGLPVTGFWATNVVNGNATVINGVSTLGNYSGVFNHRRSRNCTNINNTVAQGCS